MRFKAIKLTNWKNFRQVDVQLPDRAFLIGPNASGKSNFLDVFRFLRTIASPSGGLQRACLERGGFSKIRSLFARSPSEVGIEVILQDGDTTEWKYNLFFNRETKYPYKDQIHIVREVVSRNNEPVLKRPDEHDENDPVRKMQTALEQVAANQKFRDVASHFNNISYLHLVPQMIRNTSGFMRETRIPDMYGGELLESIARTPDKTQRARLKKIEEMLRLAVPQLQDLNLTRDSRGVPHLEVKLQNWRPRAGRQDETQLSDGTLRLIGLLWALQEGSGLILLEEPELSLHAGIVRNLASFIHSVQQKRSRQVFMSTHSVDLLSDGGISASETLVFIPTDNGTEVKLGIEIDSIKGLMESGLSAADAALNYGASEYHRIAQFEP